MQQDSYYIQIAIETEPSFWK